MMLYAGQGKFGWARGLILVGMVFLFGSGSILAQTVEKRTIRVGVFDNKPIVFKTKSNTYAGFSLDVLESIAQQEHWKLEYVHDSWKTVYAKLESGDIDLLVGIAYKPERARQFDFTRETLLNNWGVIYRSSSVTVTSLDDLQGKRIALMSGSTHSRVFERTMKEFAFEFDPVEVRNYADGLRAVQDHQADAVVINRVMSMMTASDYSVMETGVIFNPVEVRYASPKGKHADILSAIDRHLVQQKLDADSAYNLSLDKWLGNTGKATLPDWFYVAIAMFLGILSLLIFSNYIIRQKVASRTAALTESELRFRQLAENINEIFWIGSPDWKQVFYVSPAFEKIWSKKRTSLYDNGKLWLDSVHPDDLEALTADLKLKASGQLIPAQFPEYRVISSDGTEHWILARAFPVKDDNGKVERVVGIAEDITQRKKAEETIRFMAYHDSLTKLSNRNAFEFEFQTAIEQARTHEQHHVLMYIDLDQFKLVNDTCGHSAGDQMLKSLAELLNQAVSSNMMLARLGGDEFGVLIKNTSLDEGIQKARELLDIIQGFRFNWEDRMFSVGACIGMVLIGDGYKTMSELLSAADMACYAAKDAGRNRLHVYSQNDEEMSQRHVDMQWVPRIKNALEEDRFVLYRQSIVALQENKKRASHCEFLIRLLDEKGELIQPGSFLPAAERYELMPAIDRWVIHNVFAYIASSMQRAATDKNSIAFINLSAQAINQENFVEFILAELVSNNIKSSSICFEITETAAIGNLDKAIIFINRLKQEGCYFALDDFGTGMSSFSYLKTLPVDFLKIDGLFIQGLLVEPMNESIVDAITRIAHKADLQLIAEWVESDEVYSELVKIGIDYAQGYAIDRPQALSDVK